MTTHPHLEESLRRDIEHIRSKVAEMGARSESALKASVRALTERNRSLAYSVILRDQYIDELETELDRLCLAFLARHQPVAQDLRFVFSTIQINRELERIGDYAESIARQVLVISSLEPLAPATKFVELGDLAVHMLRDAVHSFLQQDASLATRTMAIEERANSLRTAINLELRDLNQANRLAPASFIPLQNVARRLERVTDQAKNLCEEVLYMCTGEFSKHKGAEGFRILFLDATNGCLSQMAESLATALRQPRFVFSSAGVTPLPLDGRTLEFLAGKGVDASRLSSKSLEQVPGWDGYQVLIRLGPLAAEGLPVLPTKMIQFTWLVHNPSETEGPPDAVKAAFEEAWRALDAQVRELLGAILQEPQPELKL